MPSSSSSSSSYSGSSRSSSSSGRSRFSDDSYESSRDGYARLPQKQRASVKFMAWAAGAPPHATGVKKKTREVPDDRSTRSGNSGRSFFQGEDHRYFWVSKAQPTYDRSRRPTNGSGERHVRFDASSAQIPPGRPVQNTRMPPGPPPPPSPPGPPGPPGPHVQLPTRSLPVKQTFMREPAFTKPEAAAMTGGIPLEAFNQIKVGGPTRKAGPSGHVSPAAFRSPPVSPPR